MSWLPSGGAPARGLKVKVTVVVVLVVVVVVVVASMPKNLCVFVSLFKKKEMRVLQLSIDTNHL